MSKPTTLTVARATGFLFVGAALALTAGCGGGGVKLESSSAFQYLPDDSTVIGSFKVDEIMKSQAYKDLMADQKVKSQDPLKEMEKEVGLNAEDLERVIIAAGGKQMDPVVVVTTKKPVTAAELTGKMPRKKFKEVKVGSFTMHEGDDEAFCVADKNTIVHGKASVVKGILERNKKAELTPGMKQALDLADQSKPIFVAINAKGMMATDAKGILPPPAAAHADKIEAVALNAALTSDAQVNLVALCQDSAAAAAIHKEADDNLKKAKEGLAMMSKEVPALASLSGEIGKVIDTVKITASGNKVSGTVSVKPVTIFTTIDTLGHSAKGSFEGAGKPIDFEKK